MSLLRIPVRLVLGAALCLGAGVLSAQDRLVFNDKHVQEGKITGVSGGSVLITLTTTAGALGQIGFDLSLISRVDAAPPAAFQTGSAAYAAGDWDRALALVKPVADQFRGLPTDWARQASAMLGDIYVAKNDLPHAEGAYNDLRKAYPGGSNSLRFSLGQARIALARANDAAARRQLEPLATAALKAPAEVSPADGAVYGEAFFLLGQLREKEGDAAGALENYLRTVTLYYQDASATARAQGRADALRAAHPDLAAP